MQQRTHEALDPSLCGRAVALEDGEARVELMATEVMRADASGLVHGGFVFGAADHAAMLAINHPNVVLGSASVRFERPVVVGDLIIAHATAAPPDGKKHKVSVEVRRGDDIIMRGELTCFIPKQHVLDASEGEAQ